ncbi:hypothetical protein HMPREF0653_01777 [Prevotella disiens JCM 6334 = ATCC 29426]|uniref:DUF3822 domain-containing protein n=3 Tax=Prevotella disiens TaxID=28130 RepID=E1KU50_9BACT|nr:DUF3822 family protein [Prevotella disiens]EFL45010.1 hypothetical protein HMPREF9296_0212 [Prevotella disiens FB035-09AN]ERJ75753.1 hypothetical protein HMPREF0653_01777 [Prevotella disiens JCM 6334 = ATCC 29426]SUB84879.1 Protein of uncharacterised function (DUF3822) [Prevotella disiens]
MMQTENNISDKRIRLAIRVGKSSMSFSVGDPQINENIVFEPYELNNGMAIAANLREAFKKSELLQSGYKRSLVIVDSPVMLVPLDEYHEQEVETLYKHTYKWQRNEEIVTNVVAELNAVAVFTINKDLQLVAEDHFVDVRIQPLMQSVWSHLYHRAFTGSRRKLFVYFHDKRMEIMRFQLNRFDFSNAYEAVNTKDTLYYILNVWKQMGMEHGDNELYVTGDIPNKAELRAELEQFVSRTYFINLETDFNNAKIAKRTDIPYDLKALYLD